MFGMKTIFSYYLNYTKIVINVMGEIRNAMHLLVDDFIIAIAYKYCRFVKCQNSTSKIGYNIVCSNKFFKISNFHLKVTVIS